MLTLEDVRVRYGAHEAVRPCSLDLAVGETVALVGPNGAGKSSLLKAIAGLLAFEGRVAFRGRPLAELDARARARTVAYLPQARTVHWPIAAREVVALGRLPHRAAGQRESEADAAAVEWAMRQTDVPALAARPVDRLSGGERARVLLARALAVQAPVLLADEPVASLDPYHQLTIMAALADYARRGALVVAVLHDLSLAARFCGRVILMQDGRVVGDGAPAEVLRAEALERHYGVEPYIGSHEGQRVIVPWRPLAK